MVVGHYTVSFVAKSLKPSIPLWILFLAVQLVDVFWAIFILFGIEGRELFRASHRSTPSIFITCRTRIA
jgi:hypothetical protein